MAYAYQDGFLVEVPDDPLILKDPLLASIEALHDQIDGSGYQWRDEFEKLNIKITPSEIDRFQHAVVAFELRGTHPLTLQSQLIGVHPIVFAPHDRDLLFTIFGTSEYKVDQAGKHVPFINQKFEVTSDPFNLFCVWLIHIAYMQIHDEKKRHTFQIAVAKYLHYRFFTSLVNRYLKHGANGDVMLAAVNSLTRKYDVITKGTWYNTILDRCEDLLSEGPPKDKDHKKSIHLDTFIKGGPDQYVVYILSDVQTRIRDKVSNICDVYYEFHKRGIKISSSSSMGTNSEGEKILIEKQSTFDSMVSGITVDLMNINRFVDIGAVNNVARQFSAISPTLLKVALTAMSDKAAVQAASNKLDDAITDEDGSIIYTGMRALVRAIVETSFRFCIRIGVPLNNHAKIWQMTRNAYTASRTSDADIISVRKSVALFVSDLGRSSREATMSSLRIAITMYILLKCFKYLR